MQRITIVVNAGKDAIAKIENERIQKQSELETKIKELENEYKQKIWCKDY